MVSSSYVNSNWSYCRETARLGVDFCDFDLWLWPFAWTSLLSQVITPENFMMIRWWEHSQKGVTDRRTDRQTAWTIHHVHRAAWSQLKIMFILSIARKQLTYVRPLRGWPLEKCPTAYRWLRARLQHLHCYRTGDTPTATRRKNNVIMT